MAQPPTILIADDEDIGRMTLARQLKLHGYQIVEARDGLEALARASDTRPDVVLLDLMMPGLDGIEVCRRLRAIPHCAEVPIIMLTALSDRDSRLLAVDAGADDFISKPFDRVELQARLRTIVRLNRQQKLLAARAQFAWVLEHVDDAFLIVAPDDSIRYANRQARRYLSIPHAAQLPIEARFLDLARRYFRCEPIDAWSSWLAPEAEPAGRYLMTPETDTARAFWLSVDVLAAPLELDQGRLVRLRNVTKQVTLHRELGGFHSTIGHKLRTPLQSLFTGMQLLETLAPSLSRDQIVEIARVARASATRLRDQIDDILEFVSAPDLARSGHGFYLRQLGALVADIGASLDIVRIEVCCPAPLQGARVVLSERAMELILYELLENSKKFHPTQTPTVEIELAALPRNQLRMQIAYDGQAIPPEQLAHIWTPYYQGEMLAASQRTGSGLGLAMVGSIVWSVGGSCAIRNWDAGGGVSVELTLPLEPAHGRHLR
jgi:two-component system, cell cycle response regulator